jgi:hypothetical protein
MRYLLFNWEYATEVDDLTEITDERFEELAKQEGGYICESTEDFQSAFNAEMFSVHTHQLRIINKQKTWVILETLSNQ